MSRLPILTLLLTISQTLGTSLWAKPPTDPSQQLAANPQLSDHVDARTWVPLQSESGDLNRDGRPDVVVALERKYRAFATQAEYQRTRALLVLFADPGGGYVTAAMVPDLLPCASCLGTLTAASGSDVFDMEITDGRLTIGWMAGGEDLKSVRLTFAYDQQHQTLAMVADDKATFDPKRQTRTRTVHDYLTGRSKVDGQSLPSETKLIPILEVRANQY